MPKNNNNKKGSKVENKLPQQEVSIKVKGQDAKQAAINQDQGNLNKKASKGKEEDRSGGGLIKGIVNFIKGIFTATIDMPQQGQFDNRDKRYKEDLIQPESVRQGEWLNNLSPETKQKVKKEGKELQKKFEMPQGSNQSIGTKAPDQTPADAQQEKSDGKQI